MGIEEDSKPASSSKRMATTVQTLDRLKCDIERMKTSFERKAIPFEKTQLECRLEILEGYIEKAMGLPTQLESYDPSATTRGPLEDLYVATKALFLYAVKQNKPEVCTVTASTCHHAQLPKMSLPKFSGKHSAYRNFRCFF